MDFKRFYKKGVTLMLVMIMVFSVAGCTKEPAQDPVEEDLGEEVEESEEIVVTDHLGREVRFEEAVETIATAYAMPTSMVIALGLKDKVVAIEGGKRDKRAIYGMAAPEFLDLPSLGSRKEFDLEEAAAVDPDVVIVSMGHEDIIKSLEDLGIKSIAINPESMEELQESLDMIAKVTGVEDRAKELEDYYSEQMAKIDQVTEGKDEKTVYLGGNSDFLSTATGQMYQSSLIENAGGQNVASDIDDTYWATISYEQLIDYNPELIVGAADADYSAEDILKDDKLESIRAVEDGEVYIMPGHIEHWDSPIASGILGTMWLTSVLHEDDYPFDDFKDDAYDFYERFYDIKIDKDEIGK